jgi:hypothetical protein
MSDLMADAATFLADQMAGYLSQTVTYRRGGLYVSLAATKCPIRPESDGLTDEEFEPCDWIIRASLIVLGGEVVEPNATTDVIEEADGQQWQVLTQPNEKAYRPVDPFRTMFRIHTKRTQEAD